MHAPRSRPLVRRAKPWLARTAVGALIALLALVALVALGLPLPPARAPSNVDIELDALATEISDMHGQYFKSVDTSAALNAAWDAAVAYGHSRGGPATPRTARPSVTGDDALSRFNAAFHDLANEESAALAARSVADLASFQTALGQQAVAAAAGSVHENHTYYINPSDWSRRGDTGQSYAGVGISISQVDTGIYVNEVFANSPAAGAGMERGDRLIAVDGQSIPPGSSADQGVGWLSSHLRGDPKTTVQLTYARIGVRSTVTLTRAYIYIPDFEAELINGVGHMRLRGFPPASSTGPDGKTIIQELDDALAKFEAAGATGWVLDLRGDGGGYLDTMTAIASRFLPKGAPLLVSRTNGGDTTTRAGDGQRLPVRPLTVLIDGGSASASEILASALQENGRALVVGSKSAGVANAADRDALPDGGGLSVTVVQSLTAVKKRPLDGQGVTPEAPGGICTGTFRPLGRVIMRLRPALASDGLTDSVA